MSRTGTALRTQGVTTERIAGDTRTDTARIAAEFARQRLGWAADLSLLARGDGFADALAGSAHGGFTASPILLTQSPTMLSEPTTRFFRSACPEVRTGDPLDAERLSEEETTVDGQDAIRREDRLTEDGIRGPEGARVTTWVIDLEVSILIASTHEVADLDYEENRDILDAMVEELDLTRS